MRAIALRPAACVIHSQALFEKPAHKTQHKSHFLFHNQLSQIRETKVAPKTPRRLQLAGKVPNGVRFWKNLLRRYCRVRRLPDNFFLLCSLPSSFSGAGEGIRTPDPLITNQMLYRLSYASNWGKARLRANLSHGSLPDVRDNYIKYHTGKFRCKL
jgi:hypothetical protein